MSSSNSVPCLNAHLSNKAQTKPVAIANEDQLEHGESIGKYPQSESQYLNWNPRVANRAGRGNLPAPA